MIRKSYKNLEGVKRLLMRIVRKQRTEQDFVILICGGEGEGKSTLMLHCVDILDGLQGKETPISSVAFSLDEFNLAWANSKKYDTLCLDEGKELDALNFADPKVKSFSSTMTKIRKEGHIYFICVTNPFKTLRYIREDKLHSVFFVYDRHFIRVYSRGKFLNLLRRTRDYKSLHTLKGYRTFSDTFSEYTGFLRVDYDVKKDAVIQTEKDKLKKELEEKLEDDRWDKELEGVSVNRIPVMTIEKTKKLLRASSRTIHKFMRDGTFRFVLDINKRAKPYKEDVYNYLKTRQNEGVKGVEGAKELNTLTLSCNMENNSENK